MRIKNESLALSGTDMTTTITSDPIWLAHIVNFSIQAVFTGTPNGAFTLQGSNDEGSKSNDVTNAVITNWSTVDSSSKAVTSSGSVLYNIENAGYRWVRLVWTDTSSGASTITSCRSNVKGV